MFLSLAWFLQTGREQTFFRDCAGGRHASTLPERAECFSDPRRRQWRWFPGVDSFVPSYPQQSLQHEWTLKRRMKNQARRSINVILVALRHEVVTTISFPSPLRQSLVRPLSNCTRTDVLSPGRHRSSCFCRLVRHKVSRTTVGTFGPAWLCVCERTAVCQLRYDKFLLHR